MANDADFDAFKKNFKGGITLPSDSKYETDRKRWADNAAKKPSLIVFPTDASDISKAILYARSKKLSLAISGGRHSPGGSSSSEGGMVIDLRQLNAISIDKSKMVAHVQGGATVRQVETETAKREVAAAVGLCGDVGIGGFITGGGLGFSLGQHGLGLDNLVSATVVLANGDIVEASKDSHPDLFWGIRGGGPNFGVVAEFVLRIHQQNPYFFHMELLFTKEQLPALVAELNQWLKTRTPKECLYLAFLGSQIWLSGYGDFDEEEGNRLWKRFKDLPCKPFKMAQQKYVELHKASDGFCRLGGNKAWRGAFVNSLNLTAIQKSHDQFLQLVEHAKGSRLIYELYDYRKMASVPESETAFAQRSTDKTVMVLAADYDGSFEPKVQAAVQALASTVSSASTPSAQKSLGYVNYADFYATQNQTDEYAREIFGNNYERLRKVKKAYDPEMVFNQWFCIRPA